MSDITELPSIITERIEAQNEKARLEDYIKVLETRIEILQKREEETIARYSKKPSARDKVEVCGKNGCTYKCSILGITNHRKACKASVTPCEHCGKAFKNQSQRVLHMKNCKEEILVPFPATRPKEQDDINGIGFVSSSEAL